MAGDHQAPEAHHGAQAGEGNAHHGAARHQRTTVIPSLQVAHHHVQSELRGRAHDQGPDAARDFVARVILPVISQLNQQSLDTNPKGRLQKIILRRSGSLPRYRVLEQSGRNNDRVFTVGVFEQDLLLGIGTASSIKEAGRLAARSALEFMSG